MHNHNNYANTSKVEEFIYSLLSGVVSDNVFAGNLPSTISENWNDMIVIDCDLPITDYGCYSVSTIYIFLYARPHEDGSKNVPLLAQMEESLNTVLDKVDDTHYTVSRQSNGADYDSNINWHRNYVYLTIKINQ